MNKLLGRVLDMAFSALVEPSLRRAKIHAAVYYVEAVRTARKATMVFGALAFCLVIMASGAILIPLALCLFMPWQPDTKAWVACTVGTVYLLVPLIVGIVLMSERHWMRMTRADGLVRDVLN